MVVRLAGPGKLVLPLLLFHLLSAFRPPLVSGKEIQPDDTSSLLKRASDNIKVRKYGEALGLLNAAIEADPVLSEAYSQRASVLRHVCRYEESERNYKKFLELKPKSSLVEKELSQLLKAQSALDSAYNNFDRGDYSKALEYIDKIVLVFSPGCLKAKLLKVKLLLALKDYSSAISETGYILKLDEDNLEALLLRGHAYYYLADHDVASRHYQKGLRLDPEHSELKKAYFGLKNLLKKTKSAEDNASKRKLRVAVEDFKAALAMDPNHTAHNVHLHLGLCKALVKLGRGEDAINSCTEALDIDGELVEALAQVNGLGPLGPKPSARVVCPICAKRFLREQNLQLHLRAHGRETKLERSADGADRPRRVYVCPVPHCKHHDVANALGDVTAVKRHYKRKHTTERDFGCRTCDKRYAVEFDLRQHEKKCGDHRCPCGLSFTRVDFTKHQNICGQMRQVADGSIISSAAGPSLYGADGDYTNANGTSSSLPVFPMTHGSEQPPQGAEQLTAGAGLSPWLEQQGATGPSNPQFDDLSAMLDDPDFWDNLPEVPTQPLPSPISGDAFVSSPTFVNDNNGGGHPLLFGYGGENATTGDGNFGTVAPFGSVYQYCGAATGTIPTPTAPRLQNAADIGVMAASSVNPSPSSFFAGPLSSAEYLREVGFEPWGLAEGSGIVLPSSVDQMVTAANEGHSGARPPSNVEPSSSLTQLHNSILMAGGISGESNSISGLSAVPFRHELPVVTSAGGSRPLA